MVRLILIVAALVALGAGFVVYVAPTFMPTAQEVITPDTGAIEYARDVIGKATGGATENTNDGTTGNTTNTTGNPSRIAGTVINMSGKKLASVPKETFMIQEATTLDLSYNALTGALPAEVRHLANLEVLDLSNNQFTGVPAEVGQLSKLRVLNLSNNPITGLPYEIGNLKNLERLELSGTKYSKQDLEVIKKGLSPDVLIVTD